MLNRFIGACIYGPGIWIIHIVSIENVANRVEFILFYKYLFFCTVGFFSIGCSQCDSIFSAFWIRSEEHTSELQSRPHLVCRLLLEKKKKNIEKHNSYNVVR